MIDQETIQRIMDAARIEEVIGDFVSLKRRGANHIGCCPFHNEKTPSFYVSPSKGIYKCFGCGEAGDVVKFLMKHEHYTYPEALQWLARKYNIDIQEQELTPEEKQRQTERDGLFHVSEFAQKYFADLLFNDEMGRAVGLSYFHQRGMSDEIIKRFGLGYCLDEWSNFTDHALKNGYSEAVLEKTGLTIFKEETGKRYDRFRGRVMFPIYSISGRVLGFSGRILSSEKQAAKYVNSPDSDIYNKSRILYGLYQARTAIAKANKCYLVEGNVDVVSMHQSGVENTVASCGTSLTVEQIRLIKRYTPNVTVLYDGDSAGIKAALRAVDLLFAEGMHVRLVLFPDGEDPDSYAQKYGSTALQNYLASHEDNFIMFKTRVLLDGVKDDPIRRAELISETARSIALVSDLLERAEYIRECAHLLHVGEEVLGNAVAKAAQQARQKVYDESRRTESGERGTESGERRVENGERGTESGEQRTESGERRVEDGEQGVENIGSVPSALPEVERHLVKLLLDHGNSKVPQETLGEDGKPQTVEYTVAEIIVSELRRDELTMTHPLCQRIFEQCALMVDMTHEVDTGRFMNSADEQLRVFAISLMMDTYTLSDTWRRKGVFVPKPEDNLLQDLTESIYTFKSGRMAQMIADLRERLRSASVDEERELLTKIQQYTAVARQLQQARNIVIAPHYTSF
ncbi:MAG: DNA primase [Bacteroidales bacterium]|nr:DNA primase [Bacteroidales bacterium]